MDALVSPTTRVSAAQLAELMRRGLLFDGAMGTMLGAVANKDWETPEELNERDPDRVREVHRAYIRAGADVIMTNSFGGDRGRMRGGGPSEHAEDFKRVPARGT